MAFNDDPLALALLRAKAARSPGLRFGGKRWTGKHTAATREKMCASQRRRRGREIAERIRGGEILKGALWFWAAD
jgi:hypothetical protein